ncbi:MAG: tetratricopeptide repeat protein [Candidatus Dadabacteria bacterium]|nr:tetratricopeptide repeat protein [Candidatus Dadabacteria bacterium]MYE61121.1 tetratricopeptide repeat protein [Candidatus Dadabacteria bacterium]
MSEERIQKFKKLLEKNPANPLVHYSLANEYFKLNRYEETIETINTYLKLKDDEGAAYRILGHCYTELEMPYQAKDTYEKGIQAASRHGHPDMAEEFRNYIESLDI